jgi:hypothetical protein
MSDTYHAIANRGNHFVAERGGTTKPHVIEDLALPEGPLASGYEVLRDTLAYLGERTDRCFRNSYVQ